MDKITTITGDALQELKKISTSSIDLVIADPPYNLGKNYGNNFDSKTISDYLEFTQTWIHQCYRVLKSTGSIYVFMGVEFISHIYDILKRNKFISNSWIVWHYTQGMGRKKGFSPRHEDILFFTKTREFTFNLDQIRVPQKYYRSRNNMLGANPGDVWKFSHVHYSNPNRTRHPTQKPEGVIERIILTSSNQSDIVLDPFSGSGTTQRVCQQLKRNCIGIELNEEYVAMTEDRLKKEFDGFDSYDERVLRIPSDLRDEDIRNRYLLMHQEKFIKTSAQKKIFYSNIKRQYGDSAYISFKKHLQSDDIFSADLTSYI